MHLLKIVRSRFAFNREPRLGDEDSLKKTVMTVTFHENKILRSFEHSLIVLHLKLKTFFEQVSKQPPRLIFYKFLQDVVDATQFST